MTGERIECAYEAFDNWRDQSDEAYYFVNSARLFQQSAWFGGWRAALNSVDAAELTRCLRELVAVVRGECPSLLNEDSGGDAQLSHDIDKVLAKHGRNQ